MRWTCTKVITSQCILTVRYRALNFISFQYLIVIQVPRAFNEICWAGILDVGFRSPNKAIHSFIFKKICLLSASYMPSAVMDTGGKNGEQKGCGPYSWSTAGNRDNI